jgi:hypothetical protein
MELRETSGRVNGLPVLYDAAHWPTGVVFHAGHNLALTETRRNDREVHCAVFHVQPARENGQLVILEPSERHLEAALMRGGVCCLRFVEDVMLAANGAALEAHIWAVRAVQAWAQERRTQLSE